MPQQRRCRFKSLSLPGAVFQRVEIAAGKSWSVGIVQPAFAVLGDLQFDDFLLVAHFALGATEALECRGNQFAIFPCYRDLELPSRTQARDGAFGPLLARTRHALLHGNNLFAFNAKLFVEQSHSLVAESVVDAHLLRIVDRFAV